MKHHILTAAIILCLGVMAGFAIAQEETPAGQFIIRAAGGESVTLIKETGDQVVIPSGFDFGYEMPEGHVLKIIPAP